MSTEDRSSGVPVPEDSSEFHPDRAYRLSADVALRAEHFGALAYHFGTRKLSFLKTPQLVELVTNLHQHPSARSAVSHLPGAERASYLRALAGLAGARMIVPA
ncbi:MAG: mycofactocin biosynthesis chaperone MftB [Saccharopolyspora sp.]|uniref:mycofactocin biosynthesis chaperone MftB n=1 Tax=Saccharopolyspora TaxID=1835 RepID=UPI00190BC181|nr:MULTISPECIES: mycofactocin biosynthesis chaperone MftB [unclassified Saccharopolyspora]MBK0870095.1 mycofactocin biosynthesis chaperone MftB [Saccharopolyspora sp. HNM0986]MBQ6644236.1 mycofactocin biosynthesis chaperone MftB [Saccharopolyspora sp.]